MNSTKTASGKIVIILLFFLIIFPVVWAEEIVDYPNQVEEVTWLDTNTEIANLPSNSSNEDFSMQGLTGNYDNIYLNGSLRQRNPSSHIFGFFLDRLNEDNREHSWALWNMNSTYGKDSLQFWEYKHDSQGRSCGGESGDGAMCDRRFTISSGGNVGIGPATPDSRFRLDLQGGVAVAGAFSVHNPLNSAGYNGASVNLNWYNNVARIRVGGNGIGAANGLDIQSVGNRSMLRLKPFSAGFGVTNPTERLEVAGNIKLSGNILSDGDICFGNCQ
jgi:hypothetical protein